MPFSGPLCVAILTQRSHVFKDRHSALGKRNDMVKLRFGLLVRKLATLRPVRYFHFIAPFLVGLVKVQSAYLALVFVAFKRGHLNHGGIVLMIALAAAPCLAIFRNR